MEHTKWTVKQSRRNNRHEYTFNGNGIWASIEFNDGEPFDDDHLAIRAVINLMAAAPALLEACKRDAYLADSAILATLTGERNKLTQINILRLQAIAQAKPK